ncbi:MAG: branched chain amino acid aminotransferase, partial [Oscillospiraceae bacterium]|nr:branched chain amino acid aminotransferase [Oscillospiraceae bacterium]MDD7674789.1 branched chain amino acid aminotransferase [Oscillospiraceae bacterium]
METLDFGSLSFAYTKTDYRYVTNYADGRWDAGGLSRDADITLNESACVLHYCQACFEGMKAYRTKD